MTQKIKPYGLSLFIHITFSLFLLHITGMELAKTHSVIELDLSLFETQTASASHGVNPAVASQEPVFSQASQKDIEEASALITQTTQPHTPHQEMQKEDKEQPQTYAENKPQETPKTQDTRHNTEMNTDKVSQKEQVAYQAVQSETDAKPAGQQVKPAEVQTNRSETEAKPAGQKSVEVKQESSPIQTKREAEQVAVSMEVKRSLFLKEKLLVISNIVQKNITYPSIARRMGWEGRVLLAIHIGEDGSLKDVRVLESSGYEVLDRNAVETVKRVANLFPKPPVDVLVKLPVNYRLE